ncbi:MAG: DUF2490 domain-containing protein [Candidatus Omnitrophica bacterium]|nr:DUF2490 domain-containing protein [Candidatus Omnitrophota bacterium]
MSNRGKIFFVALTVILFLSGACFAFDDGDFQYWNTENISYKINEDWKIKVEEEFRFGDGVSDFYYQHSDVGVTYAGLAEWLDVGVNYRLAFEEGSNGWEYENRPHFNATLKHKTDGFSLSNRGRLEWRMPENSNTKWRYRNKFTVGYPLELDQFKFTPYVADEVFVDFDAGELNRNRLYAGANFKIIKNLSLDVFYLWQFSKKSKHWISYNVLGTKIKLLF